MQFGRRVRAIRRTSARGSLRAGSPHWTWRPDPAWKPPYPPAAQSGGDSHSSLSLGQCPSSGLAPSASPVGWRRLPSHATDVQRLDRPGVVLKNCVPRVQSALLCAAPSGKSRASAQRRRERWSHCRLGASRSRLRSGAYGQGEHCGGGATLSGHLASNLRMPADRRTSPALRATGARRRAPLRINGRDSGPRATRHAALACGREQGAMSDQALIRQRFRSVKNTAMRCPTVGDSTWRRKIAASKASMGNTARRSRPNIVRSLSTRTRLSPQYSS